MSLSVSDVSSALKTQLEFLLEKISLVHQILTEDFASWETLPVSLTLQQGVNSMKQAIPLQTLKQQYSTDLSV